jgi:hypothetical protein
MGRGSGAGVIFGNSGGVMEAAVRTAYHFLTNKSPNNELLSFTKVRGYDNVKEAEIAIGSNNLKLLVVHGMNNIEPILKDLENGKLDYHFIEVMNCPGGCIGGGGQPLGVNSKQKEAVTTAKSCRIKQHTPGSITYQAQQNSTFEAMFLDKHSCRQCKTEICAIESKLHKRRLQIAHRHDTLKCSQECVIHIVRYAPKQEQKRHQNERHTIFQLFFHSVYCGSCKLKLNY